MELNILLTIFSICILFLFLSLYVISSKIISNKNCIIINKPIISNNNNTITCSVNFKGKKIVVKNEYEGIDNLYSGVEGFVGLFIPHILLTGDILIVKDKICKQFYDNLVHLKHYYETLNIGQIYFNVKCDFKRKTRNTSGNSKRVISTFTGGVDSFYTLLTNINTIDTILYCINYDINESKKKLLELQLNTVTKVANELQKKVIICKSNQRSLLESSPYLDKIKGKYGNDLWGYFIHGPCIFSNMYNISSKYKTCYIPSSHPRSSNYLWGSSFYVDHLYSSSFLKLIHHGDCTRVHKIKEIVASNKNIVFKYLKVCYLNPNQEYNCSKCEKCKRTYIPIGIISREYLTQLKTFNIDIDKFDDIKEQYLNIKFTKKSDKDFQAEIKDLIKEKEGS